ncbi:SDA1-like protein [Vairimorpha necatrix]|uniref:SDA1-like protein n=1 Tax=Vairimorpha necatrix TaxID=6039 RepID=A0AAX4JEL3_9MICR
MDIVTLSINMDKDPSPYKDEYKKQILSFIHLLDLQKQPEKLIRQTMDFLLRYANIDSSLPQVLLESVSKAKTHKLKTALIAANMTLTYKKLTKSRDFIKLILDQVHDCPKYIHNIKTIIQEDDLEIILKYYKVGNDKQKLFCYYFICFLFNKFKLNLELEICTGLFENQKVRKYCYNYFIETMNMSLLSNKCKKYGEKLYRDIVGRKDEREYVISKMKVFVTFRNRFNIKQSVVPMALCMMDPEKEDVKDLMSVIVESVTKDEVMECIKIIAETFCSPFKDDDMICYGLNLMRGLYVKFDKEVENDTIESEEETSDEDESNNSEKINDEDKSNENKKLCEDIKDTILNYVECFKGVKTKSVAYAYRSVINVLKKKKNNGRELSYICKKMTKEEKQKIFSKNEKKELDVRKNKRKYKLSKNRIRKNKKK